MPHEVVMPALGMSQDTGLIVAWLKRPGEEVTAGDALMEVETDKATMEVEAAHGGFLTDVRAGAGDAVPVGDIVAMISETASGSGSAPAGSGEAEDGSETGPAQTEAGADTAPAGTGEAPAPGREVIMPALGMSQDTGRIVDWLKALGDAVTEGDALLEVETDKATMEVAANTTGYLAAVHAAAGEDVPVGQVIAIISSKRPRNPVARSIADGERSSVLAPTQTGKPPSGADATESAKDARSSPSTKPAAASAIKPVSAAMNGRVLASPKARRLAVERGLDLTRLAEAGIQPPYHVADLDRFADLPSADHSHADTGGAERRLEAVLPGAGLSAFRVWLDGETDADAAGQTLAAFASAAWRDATGADSVVIRRGAMGAVTDLRDPDLNRDAVDDENPPALILRDLTGSRIVHAGLGAEPLPVLTVTVAGETVRASLDFTAGQIGADKALSFLGGFADRVEDPLRQLL